MSGIGSSGHQQYFRKYHTSLLQTKGVYTPCVCQCRKEDEQRKDTRIQIEKTLKLQKLKKDKGTLFSRDYH